MHAAGSKLLASYTRVRRRKAPIGMLRWNEYYSGAAQGNYQQRVLSLQHSARTSDKALGRLLIVDSGQVAGDFEAA